MIAALFVETNGVYFNIPEVDPWDKQRDARLYAGPFAVAAHPPCERYGRYWSGGPNPHAQRRELGDDDGCFDAALNAVRTWGGILEHPEGSHAWRLFGLNRPPKWGGWIAADSYGGWTCCVEQGHYGHAARKATWLYAYGIEFPSLVWGPSSGMRLDEGFNSKEIAAAVRAERKIAREWGHEVPALQRLSARQRIDTPIPFRDMLITAAASVPKENLVLSASAG